LQTQSYHLVKNIYGPHQALDETLDLTKLGISTHESQCNNVVVVGGPTLSGATNKTNESMHNSQVIIDNY
jgi:hypothetical protein